jgi:hypothetical protein
MHVELRKPESLVFYLTDTENLEVLSQKPIEEKVVAPSPEQVFAECSQKRILGLLAAMLPPIKSVRNQQHFLCKRENGVRHRKKECYIVY